jgi:WD40 repeat protein
MEAAIRFSQNSLPGSQQRFLYVDVVGKSFRLCNITSHAKEDLQYDTIYTSTKVPAFRAFDWHPSNEDLVVVGQAGGEATLLNIAEGHQDSLSFQVRSQRLCNAVSLSTQNLLAAGLDKVRTDFCLNIWDFNQRMPVPGSKGFSKNYSDPLHKLASGEPITSLKFFQDDPSLLVAGVKGQFVRLYDLREPSVGNGLQFATRCVHNLAIDWLDENYFASCYPTNDPSICVWDRRMMSRVNTPHMGFQNNENRQPELSLELKNAIQSPGTIWSLRFSKAQRGCLGVLSSTGNLKVYNLGRDFSETSRVEQHDTPWETSQPQDIYLDRTQDVAKQYLDPSAPMEEKSRIVSFDFLTSTTKTKRPKILALDGHGRVKLKLPSPLPTPTTLAPPGFLCKGTSSIEILSSEPTEVGATIDQARRRAQPRNTLKKTFKQSRQTKTAADGKRMSSLDDQAWHADLGFYETDVPFSDLLTLLSVQRLRCEAGYLLNPSQNKAIVSDSHWLQSFWAWVERAVRISKNGNMSQDNVDLSFAGVYSLWMEVIDLKNRTLGPSSHKLGRIIENLVRRLNVPGINSVDTEYAANRQLCLHSAGLAWSSEELEVMVKRLVAKNQHTKAAALALFAMDRKLAYKALRNKTANQSHKMLAMAIAGAFKRTKSGDSGTVTGDESDEEDDWAATITSLADELTDPYARAILAYVKTGDWSNVVAEESLPLKYRVCVVLRHYDDSRLTHYIAQATKDAVAAGDIEGVLLTGTATQASFDLMSNYVQRFGDLQTAVLALCPTVPRYLDEETVTRKFTTWKDAYRHMMNSWNLRFHRVRFDIASLNAAKDESGRALIPAAKQQVRLVCQYCSQSLAHEAGTNGETSPGYKTIDTPRHPLSKEKAAAIGTVCPKCERHLPRCGVCDMWLGVPDESYLPWYGTLHASKHEAGKASLDLTASIAGSIQTTLGPDTSARGGVKGTGSPRLRTSPQGLSKSSTTDSSTRTAVPVANVVKMGTNSVPDIVLDRPLILAAEPSLETQKVEAARKWDVAMSRFTVLCVKCSHGCHAAHARMWFEKHRVCPVPECRCLCNE